MIFSCTKKQPHSRASSNGLTLTVPTEAVFSWGEVPAIIGRPSAIEPHWLWTSYFARFSQNSRLKPRITWMSADNQGIEQFAGFTRPVN